MTHHSTVPWTKIDDRSPEKQGTYLCVIGDAVTTAYYNERIHTWQCWDGRLVSPTYWAPLPDTPQQILDAVRESYKTTPPQHCPAWYVYAVGHSTAEGTEYSVTIRASLAPGIYSSALDALQSVLQKTNDRHFNAALAWDECKVSIERDLETGTGEKAKTVGRAPQHRMGQVDPDSHETVPSFSDIPNSGPGLYGDPPAPVPPKPVQVLVNIQEYADELLSKPLPGALSDEAKGRIRSKLADCMHKDEASWCPFPAKLPPESGDYLVLTRACRVTMAYYDEDGEVFGDDGEGHCLLVDYWFKVPPVPTPPWLDFCDDVVNSGRVDADLGCECGALPSSMGKHLRSQAPSIWAHGDYIPCGGVEKDE